MKYLVLSVVIMLSCFGFAGDRSTAASFASTPSADEVVLSDDDGGESAISCGGNICSKGTYCCNASCGTCVPKGMECTQQSCN